MRFEEALKHIGRDGGRLSVRYLHALSGMSGPQMEIFRDWWAGTGIDRRRLVVRQLAELTEESFEVNFDPVFILAMGDEDDKVRAAAIGGLWENEDRGLIAPLIYLLRSDESDKVRAAAAEALGRFVLLGELEKIDHATSKQVEESLHATINKSHEAAEVRRRAIESIAYSSRVEVRGVIREAYQSDDSKMQGSAIFAMGRSADLRWRNVLLSELNSDNPELRYEAARSCGELELTRAIPRLAYMVVNDSDPEVKQACVWALGNIGGKEARRVLETCYESDDDALSDAAAAALDEMDMSAQHLSIPLYDETEDESDDEEEEYE